MSILWIIIIGLWSVAIILFLILIFVYKKKFSGIIHYEKIRDKVTLREKKPKEKRSRSFSLVPGILNLAILAIFVIIMFDVIIPITNTMVNEVQQTSNITTSESLSNPIIILTSFLPLFLAILPLIIIGKFIGDLLG